MRQWTSKDIKSLRKKYKLTQKVLGELSGVSTNYIYLMERGGKRPSKVYKLLLDCVEERLKRKRGLK